MIAGIGRPAVAESVPEARRLVTSLAADVSVNEEQVDSVGLAVSEAVTNAVMYAYELRDGKISKQTTFFAQEFEAPAWRARWVERM